MARAEVCALAVIVMSGSVALAAGDARAAPPKTQAQTAQSLARGVLKAHGAQQRYRALLQVAKAVHVGVYNAKGKRIQGGGAERSWHDLYLYDFELKPGMTSAFDHRVTHSLDEIAGQFSVISHDILKGRAITAATLAASFRKALAYAKKHPRARGVMDVLLVRELGKQQFGYDLAAKPKLSKVKLNELQMWLLRADLGASLVQYLRAHPGANTWPGGKKGRQAAASSSAVARSADVCGFIRDVMESDAYEAGQIVKDLFNWRKDLMKGKVPIDAPAPQDLVLAFGQFALLNDGMEMIVVSYGSRDGASHYFHTGGGGGASTHGKPGLKLQFGVRLKMTLDIPEIVARCGFLAGVDLPKGGVVDGIPVDWKDKPTTGDGIEKHGSLTQAIGTPTGGGPGGPLSGVTDRSGTSAWTFTPKSELLPPIGTEKYANGYMTATADVYGHYGAKVLGFFAQFFDDQKHKFYREIPYWVHYHEPRGYKIDRTGAFKWTWRMPYDWDDLYVKGHVCGADPYARPWLFTGDFLAAAFNATQKKAVKFQGQGIISTFENAYRNGVGWAIQAKIMPGTDSRAPYMHVENMPAGLLPPQRNRTEPAGGLDATITEDTTDCGEDGKDNSLTPPTPSFNTSVSVDGPKTYLFYDSTIAEWGIDSRSWNFGDPGSGTANSSSEAAPKHTFSAPGTYTVTLQIVDGAGQTATTTKTVTIEANKPPVASFTAEAIEPLQWQFTDTSRDPDSYGEVVAWSWNFGDGGTSNAQYPTHAYATAGPYTVTLTVTDDGGLTSTTSQTVNVS